MTNNRPRRILVVDDDHANRELLRRMLLQMTTAEVHIAGDGPSALELYRDIAPQISMLDIDMPGMDGFTLLEEIRKINSEAFVVMVSGHSGIEPVQKALKLGIGGYIVKPYSAQRVVEALTRYMKGSGDSAMLRKQS